MNPYSPEQKYPLSLVESALGRCRQERENAEFLIETKSSLVDIIQRGHEAMTDWDDEIILPNGIIFPSPRRILEHDINYHTVEIERQKVLLAEIKSAEATLSNAVRRHKQSYETINWNKIAKKQLRYDRYHTLQADLDRLEENIASLKQDLDQDMERLNRIRNKATTSSINNSATSNDD